MTCNRSLSFLRLTAVFPFNWVQRFYQSPAALGAFVLAVLYALYAVLLAMIAGLAFPAVGTEAALAVVAIAAVLAPVLIPKLPGVIEWVHAAVSKVVTGSSTS